MCKEQGRVGEAKSEIVRDVPLACADERAAVEFMEARRWSDRPYCPLCGSIDVYQMADRKTGERNKNWRWRCRDCKKMYSVRTGTVMEDSRIPLRHWCYAFWAACSSKKGVSAKQIQRMTGLSYKSALFLMHRIRWAMKDEPGPRQRLSGIVEADETYVGGKPRKKAGQGPRSPKSDKPKPRRRWTISDRKTPVIAVIQRDGQARARVTPDVTRENLRSAVLQNVEWGATLHTDESVVYKNIDKVRGFPVQHESVKHSAGEYARGNVHTNTAESFFALLKRGIYGTFHNVSRKHLHRYVAEFEYRWNTRQIDDGAMELAVQGGEGKRLTYARQVSY